jgi:ABC-type Na+ efflux pump permease subunit
MAIYAVVLPICLYPVLFWLMIQAALVVQGRREHTEVRVAVATAPGVEVPEGLLAALARPAEGGDDRPTELERLDPVLVGEAPGAEAAWAAARVAGDGGPYDAVLFLGAGGTSPTVLAHDSTDAGSDLAERRLRARLEAFADSRREAAARAAGVDPRELQPVSRDRRNLAPDEDMGAFVLSILLPFLLVLMAVLGAFYPAVDLTAGERERGTAETTAVLPVPRLAVHQGKILAVCATALLATGLNLFAIALSGAHLLEMLGAGSKVSIELPVAAFVQVLPLALLFAFATSALLCGIAALARSFKEGQALLGPVQMLFLLPGMAGMIPGLESSAPLAAAPVIGLVMTFRDLLRGESEPLAYGVCALSLLVQAVLAILFARRVLSREGLGAAAETIPLTRLLRFLRSSGQSR